MSMMEVREGLLENPWTKEDSLLREFHFHNESTFEQVMQVWDFEHHTMTLLCCQVPPWCLWLPIVCLPCICFSFATLPSQREKQGANTVEELWSRRIGVTSSGIVVKSLKKEMMEANPAACCAVCFCDYGRYPENAIGASTKIIPFDRVQDVRVTEPGGGTRQIIKLCGFYPYEVGPMIADVDSVTEIDTAGAGIELTVKGLIDGHSLREAVMALKEGRSMPPLRKGARDGTEPYIAQSAQFTAAPRRQSSISSIGLLTTDIMNPLNPMAQIRAPEAEGMNRATAARTAEQVSLLRSIDSKLGQLVELQQLK